MRDEYLPVVFVAIVLMVFFIFSKPTEAAPVKMQETTTYKIGRVTVHEWKTDHNRLCTMIVDQYSTNAPHVTCS